MSPKIPVQSIVYFCSFAYEFLRRFYVVFVQLITKGKPVWIEILISIQLVMSNTYVNKPGLLFVDNDIYGDNANPYNILASFRFDLMKQVKYITFCVSSQP